MKRLLSCFTAFAATVLITVSSFAGSLIVVQSDYSTGMMGAYDSRTDSFSDIMPVYQDAAVKSDGTYMYIVEARGADSVTKIDPADMSVVYQYSVGAGSNPKDIVFHSGNAFVMLYDSPKILMVDPDAANESSFIKSEIDISQWADSDGSPEAVMGFAYKELVYVVLQRYDLNNYSPGTAVLTAIDPVSGTLIDFDDSDEEIQGIDLMLKNPQWGAVLGSDLYLGGTAYGVSDEGVMKIDLDGRFFKMQTKVMNESENNTLLASMNIFSDTVGIISKYDEDWNAIPYQFNPTTGEVGDMLPVPDAGGGASFSDGVIYVGSRDFNGPGIYRVDAATNALIGSKTATPLPPYALLYFDGGSTSVDGNVTEPASFAIDAVRPNPFNPSAAISFSLKESSRIKAEIFNSAGQKVETLTESGFSAGTHELVWNARSMPSGIYFVRISSGEMSATAKMTLLK